MNDGWISLHRKFTENWIWKENRVFSRAEAWLDILMSVNHIEKKFAIKDKLFIVKRGESIHSLTTWGKRWKWDKSKVRRFLNLLQSDSMVVLTNEQKTTRLTVCNYDSYQNIRIDVEPKLKRKRNAVETHLTPNNNDNNINNDNNTLFAPQEISDSVRILTPENNFYREFKHLKISYEEFEKLKEEFKESDINNILDRIENHKNNKNYVSLYLTAKNWLTKDLKDNKNGKQQSISEATRLIEQGSRNKY